MTVDHIKPKSKGGENNMENYQPMCCKCNEKKADKYEEVSESVEVQEEQEIMKFETYTELLDFVLVTCSGMRWSPIHINSFVDTFEKVGLKISEGTFSLEKIFYASVLLKEQFNITLVGLTLQGLELTDKDFDNNFLSQMELKSLNISNNKLTKMPVYNKDTMELITVDAIFIRDHLKNDPKYFQEWKYEKKWNGRKKIDTATMIRNYDDGKVTIYVR